MPRLGDEVIVFPKSSRETVGRVVEDFGDGPGYAVDLGGGRTVQPARRWAIHTHDGGLVFVDTADLCPVLQAST